MILLLPLAYHEQAPIDRLISHEAGLRIGNATIVHVDAARLHETSSLRFRWGELHARHEIDDADALGIERFSGDFR